MNAHAHHIHHRSRLISTDGRSRGGRVERTARPLHPGILALAFIAAVVAVVIASIVLPSHSDRVSAEPPSMHPGIAISMPGGANGTQLRGIMYAPGDYSPPGLWRAPSGGSVR